MGQSVQIVSERAIRPNVIRFEIDRSLTGTAHESYSDISDIAGNRPPDLLAQRLFETGQVESVHLFSNIITVSLRFNTDSQQLADVVRNLFIHYLPGVMPTPV